MSSSDATANGAQYDSHGNMSLIGTGTTPLQLLYDSSDRNWGMEQFNSSGNGTATYLTRDAQGRVIYRESDAISNWNWAVDNQTWYAYTGGGDSPSFVRDTNWNITEKYISLPGGVTLTIRPQQTGNANKVYSLSNLNGAVMATTDASGTSTGIFRYDPFGNQISTTLPNNSTTGKVLGWAGQAGRTTETNLALKPIQMGARVYLPTIGRFTQVDPVPGGNSNDYVYAVDPINSNDFSGRFLLQGGSASATTLQNAAGAVRVQPAAPAPYYQPAVGLKAYSAPAKANSVVLRATTPAAKPQNNSTAMPVATIKPLQLITSATQSSPYNAAWAVLQRPSDGYTKVSIGGSFIIGGGGGFIVSDAGRIHWFFYGSIGIKPGVDASLSSSSTPVSCGWSTGASYNYLLGQSMGSDGSTEVNIGTPGVSVDRTYTSC